MKKTFLLLSMWALNCSAETLTDVFQQAKQHDQQIISAQYALNASENEQDIGLSGLLPTLSASGKALRSSGVTDLDQNTMTGSSNYTSANDYTSRTATLNLRQPLIDFEKYALYTQGVARTEYGRLQYNAAQQDLYTRISQNYFTLLRLNNELSLIEEQKTKISKLLEQTTKMYKEGEGTITDIDEAQAKLELIDAQYIDVQGQILNAQHQLSNQTGLDISETMYVSEAIPDKPIFNESQNYDYWLKFALRSSPAISVSESAVNISKAMLSQQRAGHMPKIYLAGQLSKTSSESNTANQDRNDKTIALMIDIPLYAGGGVSAYSDKFLNLYNKSQADLDFARQKVAVDTEKFYLGSNNGWRKCQALKSAVKSAEKALVSVDQGYRAGTRSVSDILNAQQNLFTAKRDLLNSKLTMLLSVILMKTTVGNMSEKDLSEIEGIIKGA